MKNIKSQIRILLAAAAFMLLTGCGVNWHISTTNYDPIYGDENYLTADDLKVDTLSYREFRWKLRTDFNFRWDYANYMMDQPLSWYYRNQNWSPWGYGAHNAWFNSHQYWTDWAFNYPFTSFNSWYWNRWDWPRYNWGWGWYGNTWNNHWYNYGYSGWYGHNSLIWSNVWRNDNTFVHVNGRRGSSNISVGGSSRGNSVIRNNDGGNRVIRRYDNPTRGRNNNVIIRSNNNNNNNNNIRVRPNNNNNIRVNPNQNWNNNNNSRGINNNRNYYTPPNRNSNNNVRSSSPPVINRGSSNISRGSSTSSRGGRRNQ